MNLASQIPPSISRGEENVAWNHCRDNNFSVSAAYSYLANDINRGNDLLWKKIWSWQGPHRIKSCLWLTGSEKLLMNMERYKRGMTDQNLCPRCGIHGESTLHALRDCVKVREIWEKVLDTSILPAFFTNSCHDWILSNLKTHHLHNNRDWACISGVTIWHVWRERNNFVFKGKQRSADQSKY